MMVHAHLVNSAVLCTATNNMDRTLHNLCLLLVLIRKEPVSIITIHRRIGCRLSMRAIFFINPHTRKCHYIDYIVYLMCYHMFRFFSFIVIMYANKKQINRFNSNLGVPCERVNEVKT